jgi:lysophospholipid acyltransferase (LPLAT)-like uncharacterized protein
MNKLSLKYKIVINLLNLLSKSWRIKLSGYDKTLDNGIIIFWHGYMLPVWKKFSVCNPVGVVSLLIRGSSSRKGKEVLDEIIASANENRIILMTPDGPQGPPMQMKAGAAVAASRTGVPIFLCGVKIYNKWNFTKSWDNFSLPKPFSKIELILSEPFYIQKDADKELINSKISELQTKLLLLYS